MSFEAVAWALEAPVGGTQKVVLIGIASHADKHGENACPSIETLAGYAYVTTRAVQMAINELVGAGLLFKGVNEGGNRQTAAHVRPNLYRLNMAKKTGDRASVFVEGLSGPAAKSGLQPGDVIIGVNNQPITGIDSSASCSTPPATASRC